MNNKALQQLKEYNIFKALPTEEIVTLYSLINNNQNQLNTINNLADSDISFESIITSLINQPPPQPIVDFSKKRPYDQVIETKKRLKEHSEEIDGFQIFSKDPFAGDTSRSRYKFVNDIIYIIDRDITKKLSFFIDNNRKKGIRALYIQGAQGVGKSHSIYQIVSRLREVETNIVFYMPDCGGWEAATNPFYYFSECMYYALFLVNDTFVNDYWKVKPFDKPHFENFLEDLVQYCDKKNYSLYLFFDHHNGISDTNRSVYPFSIIEKYLPNNFLWSKSLICLSASVNNQYQLKVAKDSWPTFTFDSSFTDQEFQSFSKFVKFNFIESEPGEALELIKEITNLVPLEIQEIFSIWSDNQKSSDLMLILNLYKKKREMEIRKQDQWFTHDYLKDDSSRKEYARSIMQMKHQVPYSGKIVLNERYMVIRYNKIEALIPLALDTLVECWKDEIDYKTAKDNFFRLVFTRSISNLTNDVIRRILEMYIIEEIDRLKVFSLQDKVYIIDSKGGWGNSHRILVDNLQTFYFYGTKVKNCNPSWEANQIIIPKAYNFPDLDFIIWDANAKHLYAVQITISGSHSDSWDKYKNLWRLQTGYEETKTSKIWFALESKFKPDFPNHYAIFLHNLPQIGTNSFPLLNQLYI